MKAGIAHDVNDGFHVQISSINTIREMKHWKTYQADCMPSRNLLRAGLFTAKDRGMLDFLATSMSKRRPQNHFGFEVSEI